MTAELCRRADHRAPSTGGSCSCGAVTIVPVRRPDAAAIEGLTAAANGRRLAWFTDVEKDTVRDVLRIHHPVMRSETGPFSGCRCGAVRLGQDVIAHVVTELAAALDTPDHGKA